MNWKWNLSPFFLFSFDHIPANVEYEFKILVHFVFLPSKTAENPLPTQLLLLLNSTQSRLLVETRGSGSVSPQNRPVEAHEKTTRWAWLSCLGRCLQVPWLTSQRSFSPESVSDLHVVVPTQMALEEVHGGKVKDYLRHRGDVFEL